MRHSRKAVMKERYTLYLRKHIFNGKYFVRNVQIGVGLVLVFALLVGITAMCFATKNTSVSAKKDVDVKSALFGECVSETKIAEQEKVDDTSEEMTTQAESVLAQVTEAATTEEQIQEKQSISEEVIEEPSLFDDRCIANVEESLNVRMEPDAESEFVGQMNTGAIAMVLGEEGEWTKIKSGDVYGYVLSAYILTGEAAETFSADYVTLEGTVLEDGVNIRDDKSTEAEILQVLDKGDTISVVEIPEEGNEMTEVESEEAKADDTITWVTVCMEDGTIGYVSADYIDVDELYELAVSAEELQRIAQEEEAARIAAEEAQRQQAMAQAQETATESSTNASSSNGSNENHQEYHGATTKPQTTTTSGECIGTFTITAYCGCSKCSSGNNRTASGTVPTEGRTIAADTSVLPYGTKVVIDGVVYTVEDCGSGICGNHIDIFFATHEQALAYGRRTVKVYMY
ncbi:MAG: SH3 domain-containing protein [Eubacteriales bacterium]|nr:SH3 domain-containing protein [Eubacteriales bacterium]